MASSSWAISTAGSFSAVDWVGISGYAVILFDVENQIFYPAVIAGSSVGFGGKLNAPLTLVNFLRALGGGVTTFSPTFFTVAPSMTASGFDNSLCGMVDLGLTVGVGGSLTGLSIYGVNHSPSVLNLSGLTTGYGAGITLSHLMYLCVHSGWAQPNIGCLITPSGDPLCGGSSQQGPSQSVDSGMCTNGD
jgi:hypothetical protein